MYMYMHAYMHVYTVAHACGGSRYLVHRLQEGLLEAVAVGAEQVDGLAYSLPHLLVLQSLVIGHVVRQLAAQGDKHVGSDDIHVHVQCTYM